MASPSKRLGVLGALFVAAAAAIAGVRRISSAWHTGSDESREETAGSL